MSEQANKDDMQVESIVADEVATADRDEKVVSVEELQRRINNERKRYDDLSASIERKIEDAVAKVKAEQAMSEDERIEAEKETLRKEIESLRAEKQRREIRDSAVAKLRDDGLDTGDEVLSLVARGTLEETEAAIEQLKHVVSEVKRSLTSDTSLPISGGTSTKRQKPDTAKSLYDKHKIK